MSTPLPISPHPLSGAPLYPLCVPESHSDLKPLLTATQTAATRIDPAQPKLQTPAVTTTTTNSIPSWGTNGISPKPFIDLDDLRWTIYEAISSIQDPEFNKTLEELDVLSESSLTITEQVLNRNQPLDTIPGTDALVVQVTFKPTVPHCSYASQIGLSIIYAIYQVLDDFNFSPQIPSCMLGDQLPDDGSDPILLMVAKLLKKSKFIKTTVLIQPGSHQSEKDLNRQFNDKERVLAAFENPTLVTQIQKLCNFYLNKF